MPITNIDHFELVVTDVDRAADFYRRLGVPVEEPGARNESGGRRRVYLRIGDDEQVNLVTPQDVQSLRRQASPGGGHFCVVWRGTMEELMADLSRNGVTPRRDPSPGMASRGEGTHVFVDDPDGNSVEIFVYP